MADPSTGNGRLHALRKKEAALRAAIAIEKVRQQQKDDKEQARLCSIIGTVLVGNAARHPDFEMMLKSIVKSATSFTEGEKKLLRAKGWL